MPRTEDCSADHWLRQAQLIPGWLTDAEARQLYALGHGVADHETVNAVEIGSWQGKSSVMIAGGLAQHPDARLHCVDPFGMDENPEYQRLYYTALIENMDRTLEQAFTEHIRQSGLSGVARAVRGYSFDIVRQWTTPIDFLFIDANHEYECVRRDFEQWTPFVTIGGVVALHDAIPSWPGALRVRDENLQPPKFGVFSQVDSLAWAVKIA